MKNIKHLLFLLIIGLFSCKNTAVQQNTPTEKTDFISLYRGACYGTCPVYKIIINGDGSLIYFGKNNVEALGSHKGRISEAKTKELFRKVKNIDWKKLPETYPIDNVDFPSFALEYHWTKDSKKVKGNSNADQELIDLSIYIDQLIQEISLEKLK